MKNAPFLFLLVAISTLASAACTMTVSKGLAYDPSGNIVDSYNFSTSQALLVRTLVGGRNPSNSGLIDFSIIDPNNYTILQKSFSLSSNQSQIDMAFNLTNDYIRGIHTLSATYRELDDNSTQVCSASSSATININSPRSSYNSSVINLTSNFATPVSNVFQCQEADNGGVVYTICIQGFAPGNINFTIDQFSASQGAQNVSQLHIVPEIPKYSYYVVKALFDAYVQLAASDQNQTAIISQLTEVTNSYGQVLSQENLDRIKTMQAKLDSNEKDASARESNAYFGGIIVGIIVGIILGIIAFFAYGKWKSGQPDIE